MEKTCTTLSPQALLRASCSFFSFVLNSSTRFTLRHLALRFPTLSNLLRRHVFHPTWHTSVRTQVPFSFLSSFVLFCYFSPPLLHRQEMRHNSPALAGHLCLGFVTYAAYSSCYQLLCDIRFFLFGYPLCRDSSNPSLFCWLFIFIYYLYVQPMTYVAFLFKCLLTSLPFVIWDTN